MRVVVVTDIPSPYQVELFNAVANRKGWNLEVIYIRRSAAERMWESATISHDHCFLFDTVASDVGSKIADCDLAIFGAYRPAAVSRLMTIRNRTGKAWAFWGERPGYRLRGWLGYGYRVWALRQLRRSRAPVWGIGEWAVEGYRAELGEGRHFFDVPYFSNLSPFFAIERHFASKKTCRFLFSGNIIRRKGVDLLVSAFGQLVKDGLDVELHILGTGPLESALQARWSPFTSRVHMHGFKQWRDLAPVYANADVLCAPSRYDGWGMVVVEALAAGMPVISTDTTGAARELVEPRSGWIIPAGNEAALLCAMRSAATLDCERRKEMSHYARKMATRQDIQPGVERFAQAANLTVKAWADDPSTN